MDPRTAASAYKAEAVENAPPIKLVRMLYQGALRFVDRAAACDPKDPRSEFVTAVHRADAIVSELRLALDESFAPQLCGDLEQLYLFVESRLQGALVERDAAPLAEARSVLATLLEGWTQVQVEVLDQAHGASRGAA